MSQSRVLLTALCVCAALGLAWRSTGSGGTALAAEQTAGPRHQTGRTDGQCRQSDHRRRPAQSRAEGHQELGHAAGRAHLGHVGRHRHRPEGRPHLGLRALRRRRGRRSGRRPGRLRQQPGRSGLQVRPQHRRGARQHRQGRHGDAARHRARLPGQRLGRRLRRQQGRHQGAPGPQVQPQGREADEPRHGRQAGQRRRPVQPAQRRRHRARRQHLRLRRARRPGHDHAGERSPRASSGAPPPASASSRPTASSSSRGAQLGVTSRRVPHAARHGLRRQGPTVGRRPRQPPPRDLRPGGQVPGVALRLRPHQRPLHQGRHGLRDRLRIGSVQPRRLAQRRAHRPARRGSHHRLHSALRARGPASTRARPAKAWRWTPTATSTRPKARTR